MLFRSILEQAQFDAVGAPSADMLKEADRSLRHDRTLDVIPFSGRPRTDHPGMLGWEGDKGDVSERIPDTHPVPATGQDDITKCGSVLRDGAPTQVGGASSSGVPPVHTGSRPAAPSSAPSGHELYQNKEIGRAHV